MSSQKISLTVILLLSILITGVAIYLKSNHSQDIITYLNSGVGIKNDSPDYATSVLNLDFSQQTPPPLNKSTSLPLIQTGWVPDWDFQNGFDSLMEVPNKFDSISPVWYYLDAKGNVTANRVGQSELLTARTNYGIKIIPSIASFDSNAFHQILSNPKKLTAHIEFLKNEVETYNLDGIDLDYESIRIEDQPGYIRLIKEMYKYLDSRGKILSIAVMPNFSDNNPWRSFVQTRNVQNWNVIGRHVHEVRIMTYNLTGGSSKYPGPIGPLDWLEGNLRYASTKIDPDKIILGVHHYAYGGWGDNTIKSQPYLSPFVNKWTNDTQAAALEYEDILERKKSTISDSYDKATGEGILWYKKDGKSYIGYYMDRRGIQARKDLSERFGIRGLAYWRLGDEDVTGY